MLNLEFAKDEDGNEITATEVKFSHNTEEDERLENVRSAIRRQLPQLQPYEDQDQVIAIVGGGPSLKEHFDDLKEKHENGMKVVSLNGTHDYLIERGIRPSLHIQLDARDFNARFVKNWEPETKYYIASQSHSSVFDALEGANVTLFHCYSSKREIDEINDYYMGNFYPIMGGTTVMLRAIPMMRALGFKKMELYGFDSCIMGNEHHAYPQDENNAGSVTTVTVGDREFFCYGWMFSQAENFISMVKHIGDKFELAVHGDGLIAHIIKTGAMKLQEK